MTTYNSRGPLPETSAEIFQDFLFLEEKLSDSCDVVTAVHPCVAATWIHCLVLDASVLEVLLELERRLVEEV